MIPGSANPLLLKPAGSTTYSISRSIRLNSSDSAYLSFQPSSAGNRKTWTWAGWVKWSALGSEQKMIAWGTPTTSELGWTFQTGNTVEFYQFAGSYQFQLVTTQVFRDPSAWFHICIAVDTTQATASNRVKIYVNGVQVTAFSTASYPSQNLDTYANSTSHAGYIGGLLGQSLYFSGLLADIHLCDGTAYDASAFGEFDATTGVWVPKRFTGSYGSQGWKLDFSNNASTTTISQDASGNNNHWTANNISVTAGAGNDSLVDVPQVVPTTSGTDNGNGGEIRGNYATFNPLNKGQYVTLSDGNLQLAHTSSYPGCVAQSTIGVSSGKWYCEFVQTASTNGMVGLNRNSDVPNSQNSPQYAYFGANGNKYEGASASAYGASWTTNDVIGVAFDADNGTLVFYKNGVSQGTAFSGLTSGPYFFAAGSAGGTMTYVVNFGQRPFAYPVSGYKALNTASLPAPLVTKSSTVFDVKLYTGNGSTQNITGLGFSPDLVWMKVRSTAYNHTLIDSVRGATKTLSSSMTVQEYTEPTGPTAFTSDGWSMSGDVTYVGSVNANSQTYAAWCWDAGSSTVTNTQGSITSSVRANATAGFSVITYTGNGVSGATIGHGLGVAPEFFIVKCRNTTATGWLVYAKQLGATSFLQLESTAAVASNATAWNNTAPSSTVITLGNSAFSNGNTQTYVCYAWAPQAGYNNAFSYTGNGSADGPFCYLGLRARFLLIKRTDSTGNWVLLDTAREGYNVDNDPLWANLADAEGTTDLVDITSNGFKVRSTDASVNASNGTYVGYAWAEAPFNYSRAR